MKVLAGGRPPLIRIDPIRVDPLKPDVEVQVSMKFNPKTMAQLGLAVVLLALAAYFCLSYYQNRPNQEPEIYFYDLSEKRLFAAPQSAVPPIQGLNDDELDAVRAVVISPSGDCHNKESLKIAYLERYSLEMKRQFETMQSQGENHPGEIVGNIRRSEAQSHTLVKRLDDDQWYPMTSDEALKIVSEWQVKGPHGRYPTVCRP